MLSKNDIKFIRSLGSGKFRKKHSLFIAEGRKVINEFLSEGWLANKIVTTDALLIDSPDAEVITDKQLQQISHLSHANDALAIFKQKDSHKFERTSLKGKLTLVCEKVQDPGNLGTIIRIADWFGVEQVICSEDSVDRYNPKVVQSTMGSLSRVSVRYVELSTWLKEMAEDIPILVASLKGENIYEAELPASCLLVLGNEASGVSNELTAMAAQEVLIPSSGGAESLNVAVSAGIICSEYNRRYLLTLQK